MTSMYWIIPFQGMEPSNILLEENCFTKFLLTIGLYSYLYWWWSLSTLLIHLWFSINCCSYCEVVHNYKYQRKFAMEEFYPVSFCVPILVSKFKFKINVEKINSDVLFINSILLTFLWNFVLPTIVILLHVLHTR